jgi:hypothetical protein
MLGNSDVLRKKSYGKRKTRRLFFLNSFTVCPSCKRKFVVCLFVDEETNGSYQFANGLNGPCLSMGAGMYILENTLSPSPGAGEISAKSFGKKRADKNRV